MPPTEIDLAEEEFDALAEDYLEGVRTKPFELYLKDRCRTILLDRLAPFERLLEIGPGPGFETLPMLRAGHRIVGVDLSRRMVSVLEARARAEGLSQRLRARVGRLGALEAALAGLAEGPFDGAYSTFGAINLEPELSGVPHALARQVRPGGRLLLVVLNRPGLLPMGFELAAGRWAGAFARLGESVEPEAIRYPLRIHLPSVGRLTGLLSPWFRRTRAEPLSVLAPPYESRRLLDLLGPSGRSRAARLDRALTRLPGAPTLGEWIWLEFERSGTAAPAPSP